MSAIKGRLRSCPPLKVPKCRWAAPLLIVDKLVVKSYIFGTFYKAKNAIDVLNCHSTIFRRRNSLVSVTWALQAGRQAGRRRDSGILYFPSHLQSRHYSSYSSSLLERCRKIQHFSGDVDEREGPTTFPKVNAEQASAQCYSYLSVSN